ncbi:MAG: ornithine cyclodeaminase family protein [Chloroflexi bacterium]|nr:ornithine cyclodeaminase family protein [Chloroflexota bacterium]
MPTLLLRRSQVTGLLDMGEVIAAVEQAFRDWAAGRARMPAKAYLLLDKGDFRAMPAAVPGAAGMKWVNVHPQNPGIGLPTVMGTIIYSDPDTGYPLAIMDATEITAYRTGATSAVASRYLARKDSRTLGLIGAGRQAYTQLLAHAVLFNLELVKVFDPSREAVSRLAARFPGLTVREATAEDAAASDIVCTVTPTRQPVVMRSWVKPGVHINAVGADAPGKEELEPAVLSAAAVFVDDIKQASGGGEINVPVSRGLFKIEDIRATLGEVITGQKTGRASAGDITVFDSTGVAIEDIAVARLVYQKAAGAAGLLRLDLVD